MLPFVTASPMCCESRIAMSKSVLRAANWVNIASCQFAFGTVLTLMVDVRPLLLVLRVREVFQRLGGGPLEPDEAEGQRVLGELRDGRRRLGGARLRAVVLAVAASRHGRGHSSMAAAASRTFRPGTDSRPIRCGYRIFCLLSGVGTSGASLGASPRSCWVVQACCRAVAGPTRGPASRVRRDVLGLSVDESFGLDAAGGNRAGRRACSWELSGDRSRAMAGGSAMVQDGEHPLLFLYDPRGRQHAAAL